MTANSIDLADVLSVDNHSSVSPADACTIVIFGASGDLTHRKLIPALFELAAAKVLARRFAILGFGRTPVTDEAFGESAAEAVRKFSESGTPEEGELRNFAQSAAYLAGDYQDPAAYQKLAQRMEELDQQHHLEGNRLYYLATPPAIYPIVIEQIHKANLARSANGEVLGAYHH